MQDKIESRYSRTPNKYEIHVWYSGGRQTNILDIRAGTTRVIVKDEVLNQFGDLTDEDAMDLVQDLSWHLYCRGLLGRPEFKEYEYDD